MKRRLAVILMADMVDYTAAMEADQAGAIGLIKELRERWLEPEADRRGGEVLKRMGDGWIIGFLSVSEAVETAQSVQTNLAGHEKIRLRIAAHLGEIVEDESDLYGAGINITARLQTEAPPGGVMISEDLYRQLDTRLAEGFGDAGAFELKNIARPVHTWQWRPPKHGRTASDEVPVIAVEPFAAAPVGSEASDAAADLTEQIVNRLKEPTPTVRLPRPISCEGGCGCGATPRPSPPHSPFAIPDR
jgi:class 3 adenylate cyclase